MRLMSQTCFGSFYDRNRNRSRNQNRILNLEQGYGSGSCWVKMILFRRFRYRLRFRFRDTAYLPLAFPVPTIRNSILAAPCVTPFSRCRFKEDKVVVTVTLPKIHCQDMSVSLLTSRLDSDIHDLPWQVIK
jgi:hypothetical protein